MNLSIENTNGMKANELRFGNLVTWYETSNSIFTIEHITKDWIVMVSHHESGGSLTTRIDIESVVPIPLTEEWLVKLGFDGYSKYILGGGRIRIKFVRNGTRTQTSFKNVAIPRQIKYVHQLQNLYFALTGEELVCQ